MSGVGELVARKRLSLGMTQDELADRIEKDQSYVSQIERGKVQRPGDDILRALADALDVPFDDLRVAAGSAVIQVIGPTSEVYPLTPSTFDFDVWADSIEKMQQDVLDKLKHAVDERQRRLDKEKGAH